MWSWYKIMKTPNNIDKPIPGRGNNEATDEIKLAVDMEKLEFDAMNDILDTLMEEFKKEAKPETSFLDWLNSKDKDYFKYILSYAPYNNLEKKDYPSMLITTSLFDNRVLYSEPVKYIAKLRDVKTDNNTQLLKCKMKAAGHGGMSGRDNAITELAEEYSFVLKTAKIFK